MYAKSEDGLSIQRYAVSTNFKPTTTEWFTEVSINVEFYVCLKSQETSA